MLKSVLCALAALAAGLTSPCAASEPLPRFTEQREAAALHFVRKHCPQLLPLLEDLKKSHRSAYELQVRETFQVTELLADLRDDDAKRYELELKIWIAENKALVLVARHATAKNGELKAVKDELRNLARELVDLDVQTLEHRVEVLRTELNAAKDDLAKLRTGLDRTAEQRYRALLDKSHKKKP